MINWDPKILVGIGFLLLLLGVGIPFLMVLQIIESTLFLNFFTYIVQFLGLVLGFLGAMSFVRRSRSKRDR
jgi:positive regulator of sigma E activity